MKKVPHAVTALIPNDNTLMTCEYIKIVNENLKDYAGKDMHDDLCMEFRSRWHGIVFIRFKKDGTNNLRDYGLKVAD